MNDIDDLKRAWVDDEESVADENVFIELVLWDDVDNGWREVVKRCGARDDRPDADVDVLRWRPVFAKAVAALADYVPLAIVQPH